MQDIAGASTANAAADPLCCLRGVVDRMQIARRGSVALDALLADALENAEDETDLAILERRWGLGLLPRGRQWSTDLSDALDLLPLDYNFSLGHRDGVYWAWIQPNDRWMPGDYEARHDHPGGSGLVVAHTAALALTCAAVILRIRGKAAARTGDLPPAAV